MPLFATNLPQFGPGLTVSVSGSRQADKKSSESPGVDLVPLSTITLVCVNILIQPLLLQNMVISYGTSAFRVCLYRYKCTVQMSNFCFCKFLPFLQFCCLWQKYEICRFYLTRLGSQFNVAISKLWTCVAVKLGFGFVK